MFTLIDASGKLLESKTAKEGGSKVYAGIIIYKTSVPNLKEILTSYGLETIREIDRSNNGLFLINEFAEAVDNEKGLLVINSVPESVKSDSMKRVIESLLSRQAAGYDITISEAAFLEVAMNYKGYNSLVADITTGKLITGSCDVDQALHQCVGAPYSKVIPTKRGRGRPRTQ